MQKTRRRNAEEATMKIIVNPGTLDEIPYMFYTLEPDAAKPLVVISHGFHCNQYDGAAMAMQLVQKGFHVLTYDLSQHGARYDGFLEGIASDTEMGSAMLRIIEDSYADLEKLLAFFRKDPLVDGTKISLIGVSLGGMLTFHALSKNQTVTAAVPMLATPDFVQAMVYGMEKESLEDFKTEAEIALLAYAKKLNPLPTLLKEETRPLLLINASKDDDVPFGCAKKLYEELKPRYETFGGEIDFFLSEDFHVVNNEMAQRCMDWLVKNAR